MTSFGNVSIQVRRAAETLGYDLETMSGEQEDSIIESLQDPKQNIFIAAAHLRDLKNIDFSGKSASEISDEDIKVIGARYNRGPDLSLEKIKENLSYGEFIIKKSADLQLIIDSVEAIKE